MSRAILSRLVVALLVLMAMIIGGILSQIAWPRSDANPMQVTQTPGFTLIPTNTLRPRPTTPPTSQPTLTPTRTLLPPPTFEPPTPTFAPTDTPLPTLSPTAITAEMIPGLYGLETPTPSSTPGCTPRKDWTLTYTVQANDALDLIAERYHTDRWELAAGNCLRDPNVITVGQVLRVPGQSHPQEQIECVPWQVLTPMDYAYGIDGNGTLTFTWIGPRAPRNLIRVYNTNGETVWEDVVDLRQNYSLNLPVDLPGAGTYTWKVFPLDLSFRQINCLEGGPWTFHKTAAG